MYCQFPLFTFKMFSLYLVFSTLTTMCLRVVFFKPVLPGAPWNPQIYNFIFLSNLRTFCGEGNGNSLQYSCLENPRDRGTWWAAVYGVAQSQTRLKWLSSSGNRTFWHSDSFKITPPLFSPFILCLLSFWNILKLKTNGYQPWKFPEQTKLI